MALFKEFKVAIGWAGDPSSASLRHRVMAQDIDHALKQASDVLNFPRSQYVAAIVYIWEADLYDCISPWESETPTARMWYIPPPFTKGPFSV